MTRSATSYRTRWRMRWRKFSTQSENLVNSKNVSAVTVSFITRTHAFFFRFRTAMMSSWRKFLIFFMKTLQALLIKRLKLKMSGSLSRPRKSRIKLSKNSTSRNMFRRRFNNQKRLKCSTRSWKSALKKSTTWWSTWATFSQRQRTKTRTRSTSRAFSARRLLPESRTLKSWCRLQDLRSWRFAITLSLERSQTSYWRMNSAGRLSQTLFTDKSRLKSNNINCWASFYYCVNF